MTSAETAEAVRKEIDLFNRERIRLRSLLADTDLLLGNEFAKVLSPELMASIRQNLSIESAKEQVETLFRGSGQRACIVVVGQTKSGKSTFINELLGRRFVAQSSTPCTARVTRLTYSERLYVRVLDRDGRQVGDTIYPDGGHIDERLLRLSGADRENPDLLGSSVEAGVPSEFLRCGVDVVDSPGLNENSALDQLTMRTIDSLLPIILYVIDAQYGLTLAAEQDIQSIRASATGVELFYLVNKMDVPKEDAPDPASGRTVADIESERARRVLDRLRHLGFLSASDDDDDCRRFFCLSSREMARYRRLASRPGHAAVKDPEAARWAAKFAEVQLRLAEFAAAQFRSLLLGGCAALRALHCRVVDCVMSKASDIREGALRRSRSLRAIRDAEAKLHAESRRVVAGKLPNFTAQAREFVNARAGELLAAARCMEYSPKVIVDGLTSAQIEERCVEEIQGFVNARIVTTYEAFLRSGAMRACFDELEELRARVSEYEAGLEDTPSLAVLKASLIEELELEPTEIYCVGLQKVLRQVSLGIRTVFKHPGVIFGRPVRDPEWKFFQAKSHLDKIDPAKLADCLTSSVQQWLDRRHFRFLEKIRASEQLVETAASLSELERQRIVALSPRLAVLYTRALEIATGYRFRGFTIDTREQLGSGAQGQVFGVRDPLGRVAMAAKRVTVEVEGALGLIASEVFYSSVLHHPNLVRVDGVRLCKVQRDGDQLQLQQSAWTIELYMELMHSDLWNLMQRQKLPFKQRIWFGLQLARALEFLHSSQLIHRDVKLQNLLVDRTLEQVKLTDFGLIKSSGLTDRSLVGTPIYLAPEMVTNSPYDTSADIYSLGIALWYLAEGSGRKHPEFVEAMPSVPAILLASSLNSRPNRLPGIGDDLWDLMERSWHQEPARRPPAGEVIQALEYIVQNL